MFLITSILGLALAQITIATPFPYQKRAPDVCQQFKVPVTASAPGAVYDIPPATDDVSTTAFAIKYDTWSTPMGPLAVLANTTISGTWDINVQLCVPADSAKSNILQLATHGLYYGLDYWQPTVSGTASYVDAVLAAGYSILTYDRLGVGQSDKPDAYNTLQAPLELEILHQLTLAVRSGKLASYASDQAVVPPFSKVVHVGHSFGSFLSSAYISTHGNYSDGAIITGFIINKELGSLGPTSFDLYKDPDLPSGYVKQTRGGMQTVFFGGNNSFTLEAIALGNATKQAIGVGEIVSSYALLLDPPDGKFQGPLLFMLPEFDFFICRGDCKGTYNVTMIDQLFPNAQDLEVYMQPNTGHGLTLHKNATAGYKVMLDYLSNHGL